MVVTWIVAIAVVTSSIVSVVTLYTTMKVHVLVNSNHQEELARVDQLTQTIVNSPNVDLPSRLVEETSTRLVTPEEIADNDTT